jgi:hypothetical protein
MLRIASAPQRLINPYGTCNLGGKFLYFQEEVAYPDCAIL